MPKINGPFHSLFYPDYNGDRIYSDEDFGLPFRLDHSNGVYLNQSTQALQIVAAGDMNLTIRAGYCFIEGHFGGTPQDGSITLDNADGTHPRIDRIVMRHYGAGGELDERKLAPLVLTGTPAQNPKAPDIVRNGTYYDLSLATVLVPAGAIEITAAHITDTRFDTSVCGAVTGKNENPLDTTELFAQFTALFEEMTGSQKAEFAALVKDWADQTAANQAAFDAFMGQLHDVMGENAATNLLNLVNGLRADVDRHTGEISQHGDTLGQYHTRISTLESHVPTISRTGAVQWFAGSPPSGWILCDGRAVSTSTYSRLYSAIGRKYTGSPGSSSTFNVPNILGEQRIPAPGQMSLQSYFPTLVAQDYSAASLYGTGGCSIGDAFMTGFNVADIEAGNLSYNGKDFIKKGVFYWDRSLKQATNISGLTHNLIYSKKANLTVLCPDLNGTSLYIGTTPEEVLHNPADSSLFTKILTFPVPSGVSGYKFLYFALGPQTGDIYVLCQTTTTAGATAYFVNYTSNGFTWTTLGGVYGETTAKPTTKPFAVTEYSGGTAAEARAAYLLLEGWVNNSGTNKVMIFNAAGSSMIKDIPFAGAAGHKINSYSDIGIGCFGTRYAGVYVIHNDGVSPIDYFSSVTRVDASGNAAQVYQNRLGHLNDVLFNIENIRNAANFSYDDCFWFIPTRKQIGRMTTSGNVTWYPLEINRYMRDNYKNIYMYKNNQQIFPLNGKIIVTAKNYRGESGIWSSPETLLPYINAN